MYPRDDLGMAIVSLLCMDNFVTVLNWKKPPFFLWKWVCLYSSFVVLCHPRKKEVPVRNICSFSQFYYVELTRAKQISRTISLFIAVEVRLHQCLVLLVGILKRVQNATMEYGISNKQRDYSSTWWLSLFLLAFFDLNISKKTKVNTRMYGASQPALFIISRMKAASVPTKYSHYELSM